MNLAKNLASTFFLNFNFVGCVGGFVYRRPVSIKSIVIRVLLIMLFSPYKNNTNDVDF